MVGKDQDFYAIFHLACLCRQNHLTFAKRINFLSSVWIDDIHHISPYMNFHGFHNVLMLTSWIGWVRSGKV